jgi:hypothetical protein
MKNTRLILLLLVMLATGYAAFFMPDDALNGVLQDPSTAVVANQPSINQPRKDAPFPQNAPSQQMALLKPVQGSTLMDREALLSPLLSRSEPSRLFDDHTWVVPVKKPPPAPVVQTAPPNPFKYLGKQQSGSEIKVFLSEGEKTWVVQENATLGSQYRVESIRPPRLTLVYLPLNIRQDIVIGNFE